MKEISQALPAFAREAAETPKAKNAMGKDDFMKLLLVQLQHQDPMKPMDHEQFSAQLAQFSSLEQLTNIGTGVQGLRSDRGEDMKVQAISMIGKQVKAGGNDVLLTEGQPVKLNQTLSPDLQSVNVKIYDGGGRVVRELNLTGKNAGSEIVWDGKSQDGKSMPSGRYTFRVHGVGPNGNSQEVGAELSGTVAGVEMNGKTPVLLVSTGVGKSRVELSKVTEVMVDSPNAAKPPEKLDGKTVAGAGQQKIPLAKPESEEVESASAEEAPIIEPSGIDVAQLMDLPSRSALPLGGWKR